MRRFAVAALAVILWVVFLKVYVPASFYTGSAIGMLLAAIALFATRR